MAYLWFSYYTLPTDGVGGFIREATFGRMEDMQQGETHGRNYDAAKVAMFDSFWFGEGDAAIRKAHPEATPETFYYQVAKFGFFGIVIYYLYIVYGTIANREKDNYFKIFIILALLAWQRPSFLYPLYIVFFYILYFYKRNNQDILNTGIKQIRS